MTPIPREPGWNLGQGLTRLALFHVEVEFASVADWRYMTGPVYAAKPPYVNPLSKPHLGIAGSSDFRRCC